MKSKIIKILQVINTATFGCPVQYISLHTKIKDALKIIEILEHNNYICRCKSTFWSLSNRPQFKITT